MPGAQVGAPSAGPDLTTFRATTAGLQRLQPIGVGPPGTAHSQEIAPFG